MSSRLTVLALALAATACGGGSGSPSGPGAPAPGGPNGPPNTQDCRQIPAAYTASVTGATSTGTCSFDASSNRITCTDQYSGATGTSVTAVSVMAYASRADIVDEIRFVPPLRRATSLTNTYTQSGSTSVTTYAYSYDGQGRLVQEVESILRAPRRRRTPCGMPQAGRPPARESSPA